MVQYLKNNNFKFLAKSLPDLATYADLAEQYAFADTESAAVKLRNFAENFVDTIYRILNIPRDPDEDSLYNLISNPEFKKNVPPTVIHYLNSLRVNGNRGAHGIKLEPEEIISLLKQAHLLAKWIYASYLNGNLDDIPEFVVPEKETSGIDWNKEKSEILKQIFEKERALEKAYEEINLIKRQNLSAASENKTQDELFASGKKVADELKFNEEETRRLIIDDMIASAGWNIGANTTDTEEVKQEFEVKYQPTPSGIGYADYVLTDDSGKPLAVIEAKKTSKDPYLGRKQAELYADGLEKMFNQRPIIFYTNGYETFLLNDKANEPPRRVYGFYSKDSLQYLMFQRNYSLKSSAVQINCKITDRPYQIEAIKRVLEKFETKRRKALIVQATGTGKTRVAISITDVLMRSKLVKRVLFLCDRRELRKQAKNAFQEFIPGAPLAILNASSANDKDRRIYLATYPAMNRYYQYFDIGFFDLIIADESHRSIYKAYRDLFSYFDAYQIGLTATPVDYVHRNTFKIFDCRPQDPTAHFSYEEAITGDPPYLSRFEVTNVTTKFLRDGIKYSQLSREQQIELEEQLGDEAESIDFESAKVDKAIFNKDTNRLILRNLMENGYKLPDGTLGKTIIFARNHRHAIFLEELFNEMYSQYGGKFCRVIDNYDPRADQLIDDFKGIGNNDELTIAISVDMLDTGIDIPEILNLVFAKPVKSYVKFWQMIGRGTRLCPNLLGPGKDKKKFYIFDHWQNFEWFDVSYKPTVPSLSKSLMQRLFEERILIAENALNKFQNDVFDLAADLIESDVTTLSGVETISVKEKILDIKKLQSGSTIKDFSAETKSILKSAIAPLMQWIDIRGNKDAYSFDLLIAQTQNALITGSGKFADMKDEIINRINSLQKNINQVKAKAGLLQEVISEKYWEDISAEKLEKLRKELRSLMKFRQKDTTPKFDPYKVDVTDGDVEYEKYEVKNHGIEMAAYKERVEDVLNRLFDSSATLQKIKAGKPVNDKDIEELISLVLTQHPDLNLQLLREFYPDTTGHLDLAIRRIIGLDPKYIDERFTKFIHNHPELNATQIKFVQMLKNHIAKYGYLTLETLFNPPFTNVHTEGVYGVFPDESHADEIINIVKEITQPYNPDREGQ